MEEEAHLCLHINTFYVSACVSNVYVLFVFYEVFVFYAVFACISFSFDNHQILECD